jgi:hypothetical protein
MPFVVALVLSAVAALGAPQPPPPSSQPPPRPAQAQPPAQQAPARDLPPSITWSPTGVIRGRITTPAGEPVRRATVTLAAAELKTARAVATDADGRFEFQHLPPAKITVTASKTGFVSTSFGQKRPFQAGRAIELAAGQVVDKVDVVMPRAAVIAGRVVNDLGEPSMGVSVAALRRTFKNGTPTVAIAGTSIETNDLGQYRISGLSAGSYFVFTLRPGGLVEVGSAPDDPLAMGSTFYPSAPSVAEAKAVTVRLGREVPGVDVTQMAVKPARISGVLLDSSGRPATDGMISIRNYVVGRVGPGTSQTVFMSMPAGQWTLKNVLPGEYELTGEVTNSQTKQREPAAARVTVFDADVEGVVLQAMPPARITGRVVIDSARQAGVALSQLRVATVDRAGGTGATVSVPNADGTFDLRGVPTEGARVVLQQAPAGWALEAVRQGEADVTDRYLDVSPGSAVAVDVVVTDRITALTGAVETSGGKPALDVAVLVFSADSNRWTLGGRAIAVARTNERGAYSVSALPPGAYCAIALEYVDDGEESSPELLQWAQARAVRVELAGETPVKLDLKLVRYEGGL